MSFSSSPDRVVRGGSESGDSAASPCDAERDEELRLAAEMGQLLISQKRELQTALDAARGDAHPCCPRVGVCVVGGNAARGPPYRGRAEQRVQTADEQQGSDARVLSCLCAGERDVLRADLHGWTQFAEQAGGAGVCGRGKRAACVRKQARMCARWVPADAHSGSPVRRRPWSGVFLGRCE
jgi:hypothetical protein